MFNIKKIKYSNYYSFIFTVIFIVVLLQYPFSLFDAIFYDFWVKFDVGVSPESSVVVVAMDEESDQFLGETYPYTYATHARFLEKILQDQPAVINFLPVLQEPYTESDKEYAERFVSLVEEAKNKKTYFRFGTSIDAWGEQLPPKELQQLGYSISLLNVDSLTFAKDDVNRRAILNISGEDSLHLWSAKKYDQLHDKNKVDVNSFQGSYYNLEADANFALFRYSSSSLDEDTKLKKIPYHRIVVGNFPKGFFKDKVVVIGPQYISNPENFIATPFSKEESRSPKLNVHALIIDALIKGKTVIAIPQWVTSILAIIITLLSSFVISRVQPAKGLLLTSLTLFGIFIVAYLLFVGLGVWLKIAHLVLSIFVVYYIWVPLRAIAEYQRRYKIEEEAKIIQRVDKLKQNFISLMSHDLKTPVAKIAGITDLLKLKTNPTSEQVELIDNINRSTTELNNFITSILDLTKVESRDISLNKENKDINKLIEVAANKLRFEANNAEMTIETELEPLYPIQIDVKLMDRVISNLLGNAIKYAGTGKKVTVKTWDDSAFVYVEIADNGVGIAKDDLENIFDKFYRVKNDSNHAIKGSGLGLYLVKYFIELHDGTIEVRSEVGEGTTFTIKLKNE